MGPSIRTIQCTTFIDIDGRVNGIANVENMIAPLAHASVSMEGTIEEARLTCLDVFRLKFRNQIRRISKTTNGPVCKQVPCIRNFLLVVGETKNGCALVQSL
jgi:hypothetical protein